MYLSEYKQAKKNKALNYYFKAFADRTARPIHFLTEHNLT